MKAFSLAIPLILSFALGSLAQDQVVMSHTHDITPPEPDSSPLTHAEPTLFDLLTIEPSVSIFFSYARETKSSRLLVDQKSNITVLVPTNRAVMALARKPHQDPVPLEDGIEISEQEFDNRSKRNVERWVSLHIIPEAPIFLASHTYPTLADGRSVSFKEIEGDATAPEWTRVLLNGEVQILRMKNASNGVFYLIDGTVVDE
ncbi:hypothetical protein BV25DRAFT_1828937 [Artomyces pyxidatus]|uniref:Uncharacterized protein n=1 Tax=Artomyces pyxidatus TaxID=48021 RepID=A0ACB8SSD6_9AGAM|nr:hypothetical protein BV25DRAFT_1828937 [Artomyces pyxidatus]